MNYSEQNAYKELEKFLPEYLHFSEEYKPHEEWWEWKGNKIHLDTFRNPAARAKIILLHGVGTNGRQRSMILGGPLAKANFETISIDMPLYGLSEVNPDMNITYDDWVKLADDYINYELSIDNRPIFLYGLSAGGMETYHVACRNKKVKGIIGMTFLDQNSQTVKTRTTKNFFWAYLGTPLAKLACLSGLSKFKIKMSICSKMNTLCNNKKALKVMLQDKTSGGNSVTMKFIYSYMAAKPDIKPEDFDICPILLTQPEKDRWTPLNLSMPFLNKINKAPVNVVILQEGGHYPVETKALRQLYEYSLEFINKSL